MTDPRLAEAQHLLDTGCAAEAARAFAAAATAGVEAAWAGLGEALSATLDYADAIPAFRRALALAPAEAGLRVNLARALFALGHVSEAMRETERAIREGDAEVRALALRNQAIMAPGDPDLGNAEILRIRRRWALSEAASVTPLMARPRRGAKLRIAYYGAFFAQRNWMKMYMGVINAHDRDRFEINLIVDGAPPCAEAGYHDHDDDRIWEVTGLPNDELAGHIAEAGIDVLVDLNGYSHVARLPLLLHRAAPVQVAWNGMFATTGFPHLDALVGDASAILPEEERFCSEPVRRVTHTYLPFWMFYATPPVAPPPCLQAGRVTFGSLASAYKLTSRTLATWAAVLRACPGSRLLLRNRALDHAGNRAELVARFAAHGIGAERLDLRGGAAHEDFLRTYDEIDISLDTFPYNGGTTTAEALWQGVPVLTTVGDRWAGRTSRSLLLAAGFPEDVLPDEAALVARAAAMARDPDALAARRATQRERVAASPAADPAALCRELEALYLELAERASTRG
ncbi:O-linked N-acetylglucosamine transferase, SPINDLY family protein [Falsiroseomonas oryziterrae]|uniref:O-linked N-acetylglucosamine transferase, SPINDLY family protein n=1 Tax=Falsiroseomonas oryziterrae TaxID=2911368 RepID=UPI001F30CB64|nr:tetratricopeptide repeat protein [Roseomonas sp. NPKOSM-4]